MAITSTEFLTDRARVHFFCPRPWGTSDEYGVVEVPYATISALPGLPVDHPHGLFRQAWEESVYVPAAQATIQFRFEKWQETDDCRMEGLVGGPYLTACSESGDVAAVQRALQSSTLS